MSLNIGRDNLDRSFRYKMPPLQTKIEGRGNGIKTVILNMVEVGKALHIDPAFPTKYFGIELGAQSSMNMKTERAVVNGAHTTGDLQKILDKFIQVFILCPTCKLPEIKMNVKNKIKIDCAACGHSGLLQSNHKLVDYIIRYVEKEKAEEGEGKKKKDKKKKKDDEGEDDEDNEEEVDVEERKEKKKKKKKKEEDSEEADGESKEDEPKKEKKKKKKKDKEEDVEDSGNESDEPKKEKKKKKKKKDKEEDEAAEDSDEAKKEKKKKKKKEKEDQEEAEEKDSSDEETKAEEESKKEKKAKKEEKSDKDFLSDTSKEAQKARKEAEFAEMKANRKDIDAILAASKTEKADPVVLMRIFLTNPRSPVEILSELRRMKLAHNLDDSGALKLFLESLLDPANISAKFLKSSFAKKEYVAVFRDFAKDKASGLRFIGCLEELMGVTERKLLPFANHLFQIFYEEDVLPEDTILSWFESAPESSWQVKPEISIEVRKKSKTFIEWLKNADEEGDEE